MTTPAMPHQCVAPLVVLAPVLATGVPWCERTPGTTTTTPHGPVSLTSL
ncbi:MAG: hypothetical protein Q8O81_13795 [Giesbergeria sp.]|nr:hypothetical protein [Giesbergeria sp.]